MSGGNVDRAEVAVLGRVVDHRQRGPWLVVVELQAVLHVPYRARRCRGSDGKLRAAARERHGAEALRR